MKGKNVAILLGVFLVPPLSAEEGMWTLDNFPRQAIESNYDIHLTGDWLKRLQLATVRLEGGCTGSFVSPQGLILTNHHCVRRCISQLSTAQKNIETQGFYATEHSQEQPCQEEQISVLLNIQNITEQISAAVQNKQGKEADKIRKETLIRLEQVCQETSKDSLFCESVSMYDGRQHFLYKYKRYRDVRLVFAPETGIAAFGGDPDNFMFPRYCLDIAFLRVYENGTPAHTPNYFHVREFGAEEGELVFVAGHPGSSERQLTLTQLKTLRDFVLPVWLLRYSELRGRLIQFGKTSAEAHRIIQTPLMRIENQIKIRRNKLSALLDGVLLARKEREEKILRELIKNNTHLNALYGQAWDEIEKGQQNYRALHLPYIFAEKAAAFNTVLFSYARTLVRGAVERNKPNKKRLSNYTRQAMPRLSQWILSYRPIYPGLEEVRLSFSLEKMREWLGPDHEFVKNVLGLKSPEVLAHQLITKTQLGNLALREKLWKGGEQALHDCDDPMITLAKKVDAYSRTILQRYKNQTQSHTRLGLEKISRAKFEIEKNDRYPDATFTLRVSYGSVQGWKEQDKQVSPFTQISTVFKRATGKNPFRLPTSWIQAKNTLDMSTRFNFVTTNDITGGNSGSPVVDREGRLVGLIFDGNIHSIAGSYWFNPLNNRAVAVHPSSILESLRKIYGARELLSEIEVN